HSCVPTATRVQQILSCHNPPGWSVNRSPQLGQLVSGAKLAPQGRLRKAQGASPGNKHRNKGSPEGAMQLVPVPKRRLMTSIYLELRSNSLCRPFRAFRNLDLEPRACALGCPAGPLRGPWFRARNELGGILIYAGIGRHEAVTRSGGSLCRLSPGAKVFGHRRKAGNHDDRDDHEVE